MTSHKQKDMWTGGAGYEYYVGRWSRLVARQFLTWLDVPSGSKWLELDVGQEPLAKPSLVLRLRT